MRIPRSSVIGLRDEDVCWAVVDPIWPTEKTDDELALIGQGTQGQQTIYVTMLYAQEVDNGGLAQFFGNSSGMLWREVKTQLLDSQEQTEVLTTAIAAFPKGSPSAERSERQETLRALTKEQRSLWRAGEDRIYRLGGFFGTLKPFWTRYIESHPEDFFLPTE
jgi:hypothetical protein